MCYMKLAVIILVVFFVGFHNAADLQVGTSINNQLAYSENVKLSAIPFTTRIKNVFYNDNTTRIIKGIWAIDRDQSKAKVTITSGGVGSSFVNLKIKSEKGDGLDYQVQVFV
ncbi:Uncharacterized protein OBRU01_15893 [Operophtera brumata]|uniref:Salivary secreted peptide n=1 Tax=Operophtera brumata TaxID=104452 RepID=A0A0L7L554_OPEBR|nr:Uncharacterized protein OBRU01_15893 [Operophtera brumata]